jgi:hypothetical protein
VTQLPSRPHPLNSAPLGTRFVVRWRLEGSETHSLTDTLGILVDRTADHVTLRTRTDEEQVIPKALIEAAQPVPPAPTRRRSGGVVPSSDPPEDDAL